MSGPSSRPFAALTHDAWTALYAHWLLGASVCVQKAGKRWRLVELFGPWPPFPSKKVAWSALSAAVLAERVRRRAAERDSERDDDEMSTDDHERDVLATYDAQHATQRAEAATAQGGTR